LDIEKKYPKAILVSSKRNYQDQDHYDLPDLISRALQSKSNLFIEFTKGDNIDKFTFRLLDPLGNQFYFGDNVDTLCLTMFKRIQFLQTMTRTGSYQIGEKISAPISFENFLTVVKEHSIVFNRLIQKPSTVTRFLGNTSFRCTHGFPSLKQNNQIFVSRRNVDKSGITTENMVAVKQIPEGVGYYGQDKPSVDTPIQLELYKKYPHIQFMLHGHVYVKDAPFTNQIVPCGSFEEVEEICKLGNNDTSFVVNLKGHGFTALSTDIQFIQDLQFYSRPVPEEQILEN
jgi:hypothetical protein